MGRRFPASPLAWLLVVALTSFACVLEQPLPNDGLGYACDDAHPCQVGVCHACRGVCLDPEVFTTDCPEGSTCVDRECQAPPESDAGPGGGVAVDECALGLDECDPRRACQDLADGYACGPCPDGYGESGALGCVDVDECALDNGGCDPLTSCTNTPGSRTCGPCPTGYSGTGADGCVDVNECVLDNGGCDPLTSCTNTPGARTCGPCPSGYVGDGELGCQDADECLSETHACHALRTCENTIGSYTCAPCPQSWTSIDATGCEPVHECDDDLDCTVLSQTCQVEANSTIGMCPARRVCADRICSGAEDQVCGCDGEKYWNRCSAEVAGVGVASLGACP